MHLSHPKFEGVAYPHLMDLAMEMSANDYITEPLPPGGVTWASFRVLRSYKGESTMSRYLRLVEARRRGLLALSDHFGSARSS